MTGDRQRRPKLRAVASKHQKGRRKRKGKGERGGGGGSLVGWGRWLGGGSGEGRNQCELLVMRSQMAMRPRLGRLDLRVG
jgi:hypothetical protein